MTAYSAPTFTHFDALVTFGTGVLLPSGDVYSDIGLSVKLLNNESYGRDGKIQHLFGWIIWIPIIINLLFTIPHYLRLEKTWKQRLLTFPLLLCQCWPQYRSMRVLWFAYGPKNIAKCLAEKLDLEQNVSNLEPFLEATPQVHITLMLLGQDVLGREQEEPLIWTSFAISIFSAAFGIAKLLKNGPIKMARKDGKMGGYGTPGFILLMIVVALNMVGKALWMALGFTGPGAEKLSVVWIWALGCLLPQFLLTLIIWLINFGAKTTCQFLKLYPSYFLLGIFSPFMVSGEVPNDGKIKTISISTKWTLINFSLSVIGSVSGYLAYEIGFSISGPGGPVIPALIAFLPTFVPAAVCLALLFFSEKLCSSCCKVNLPILYKTGVDINDFSKIIDLQTEQDYGTNEEESKEMDGAHQLDSIASSVVEISNINAD